MKKKTKPQNRRRVLFPVFTIIITLIAIFGLFMNSYSVKRVQATTLDDLYEELKKIEEELNKIKNDKQDLEGMIEAEQSLQGTLSEQIQSLTNNISLLELDIKEKQADIKKKETEIKILEEEITEARQLINNIEGRVEELDEIAADIIKTIYIESKTTSIVDMFLMAEEGNSFISQLQYHTAIGTKDQTALENLEKEKASLEKEKETMEKDMLEVEKLAEQVRKAKELLEKDKEQLSAQKIQKAQLLEDSKVAAMYYGQQYDNLSDEEMKKEAEMDKILQQIVNSATKPKGYAVKGQIIATEGSNGCSTGPHTHYGLALNAGSYIDPWEWVNPCNYLPTKSFWYGTCSGNGQMRYPYNDPFYSSRGFSQSHMAIDIIAGPDKSVRASHDGYYFEKSSPCGSWCSYGCYTPTQTCVVLCEDVNCEVGKITTYCHVNFLSN